MKYYSPDIPSNVPMHSCIGACNAMQYNVMLSLVGFFFLRFYLQSDSKSVNEQKHKKEYIYTFHSKNSTSHSPDNELAFIFHYAAK